jgi:ankyrin repeat protein
MMSSITGLFLLLWCQAAHLQATAEPAILTYARIGDERRIRELLSEGADPNAADGSGITAPMYAVWGGDSYVVEGMRFWRPSPTIGRTASVQLLLNGGAEVNRSDKDGRSALAYASVVGNTEAVKLLLARRADVNKKDRNGFFPSCWPVRHTVTLNASGHLLHAAHV